MLSPPKIPNGKVCSKASPFEKGEEVPIVADEKKRLIIEKLEPRTV
jgi:hypothetical protein